MDGCYEQYAGAVVDILCYVWKWTTTANIYYIITKYNKFIPDHTDDDGEAGNAGWIDGYLCWMLCFICCHYYREITL